MGPIDVNIPTNAIVSRVLVHPTNPQTLVIGIYIYHDVAQGKSFVGGAWRSTDGGVHFTEDVFPGEREPPRSGPDGPVQDPDGDRGM